MSNPTELPDLDRQLFEAEAAKRAVDLERSTMFPDRYKYQYAAFLWDFWQSARRAQPKGEAPQAVAYILKSKATGSRDLVWPDIAANYSAQSYDKTPLTVVAPAAQHADSGAPAAIPRELIERVIERLSKAQIFPLASELRAALAAQPQGAQAPTDEEIIAAVHACGVDTHPSKYDLPALQVEATSVPVIRDIYMKLATRAALAAKAEAPAPEWGRVRTVGDMVRNLLTLNQAEPIFSAFHVDFDGARRCRTSPISISHERVIDGKWVDQTRKDVPYATVVWAKPDERAQQAAAPGSLDAYEMTRLRRLMKALGQEDAFERDDEHVRGYLCTVLGIAAGRIERAPGTPEAPADKNLPGWERGIATVTLTGHQLREALDFINPDGDDDEDQRDDWLTLGIVQHKDDDGNATTGLCCWNEDSDGVLPLDGEPRAAQLDGGLGEGEKA